MSAPPPREASPLATVSLVLLLGAAGVAAGSAVYLFSTGSVTTLDPLKAFQQAQRALWPLNIVKAVYLTLGALAGLFVALRLTRASWLAGSLRAVLGAVLGALAGLATYCAGYVAATYPILPDSASYALYFVEAVYTLTLVEFFSMAMGAAVGVSIARHSWRFQGILAYIALVTVVAGYVTYSLLVTIPRVPGEQLPFSLVLFGAEAASLGMVVIYSFYNYDVYMRKHWRRSEHRLPFSKYFLPKVAFHVAIYNEPPAMVQETLDRLIAVDYPPERKLILVVDDSTDPRFSTPVEAYCREKGLFYLHRDDRRGFKAGALNEALRHTPEDADLIAVIDADYQVEPTYLRETVGYFINPRLAFIQTPQDYRNRHQSFLAEQYFRSDAYFYRAILPSRNEENAIIFCGTMGIIRRSALDEVGGWGEEYITEDAELSVRLLMAGYDSLYVNRTYGRGLVPATFDAYKKQHHRWAFGGVRILKGHLRHFLFSRMSRRQKFDFLVGGIHWFDGVYILTIALVIAAMGLGDAFGWPIITHHSREVWLIGLVPLFLLVDGLTRLHLALRRSVRVGPGGTLQVLGMWFAIKFNNTFAALKALVGFDAPFVRTPKAPERRLTRREALSRALELTRFETAMMLLMLASAAGVWYRMMYAAGPDEPPGLARALLVVWIAYYALIFATAPLYAYKSFVTFTPEPPAEAPPAERAPAMAPS